VYVRAHVLCMKVRRFVCRTVDVCVCVDVCLCL